MSLHAEPKGRDALRRLHLGSALSYSGQCAPGGAQGAAACLEELDAAGESAAAGGQAGAQRAGGRSADQGSDRAHAWPACDEAILLFAHPAACRSFLAGSPRAAEDEPWVGWAGRSSSHECRSLAAGTYFFLQLNVASRAQDVCGVEDRGRGGIVPARLPGYLRSCAARLEAVLDDLPRELSSARPALRLVAEDERVTLQLWLSAGT